MRTCNGRPSSLQAHLVIDVGNVHYKMYIISEVIGHNPAQYVLCDIVSKRSLCIVQIYEQR
jgi:hypothetical protein